MVFFSLIPIFYIISTATQLKYDGGKAIYQNPEVYIILYGKSTYDGKGYASFITDGTVENFYKQILDSSYIDWLSEYNIDNQTISRGKLVGTFKLNVSGDDLKIFNPRLLVDAINNDIIPTSKYAIYMFYFPGTFSDFVFPYYVICAHSNAIPTKYGTIRYGAIPDCPSLHLPGNQQIFWSGVAFIVLTIITLFVWPLITCSARLNCYRWNERLWCGPIAITGKTLMHIFFLSSSIVCLVTGIFLCIIGNFEFSSPRFLTGIAIICTGGSLILLWLLTYVLTTCCIKSIRDKTWCFESDCCGLSLWKINVIFEIILAMSIIIGVLLISISFMSNMQVSSSHELMEIITTGWEIYDAEFSRVIQLCDQCQVHWTSLTGTDGVVYYVQQCWSNLKNSCISSF